MAAAGYFFITNCYHTKFALLRENGQRLYLTSILWGFYFLFLFLFLVMVTETLTDLLTIPVIFTYRPNNLGYYAIPSVIALAVISAYAYNKWPLNKQRAYEKAMKKDDFESILYIAQLNMQPVAISLESRKVYVGYVHDALEPGEDSYLTIIPAFGGYRQSEKPDFILEYVYDIVLRDLETMPGEDVFQYAMTFPRNKIWSIHLFHEEQYDSVQNQLSVEGEDS